MLITENVTIEGAKCLLVPYTRDLVEQYHSWFVRDPELLESTCSELLTLEEEFANQESWRTDESKLTFLIRDKSLESSPLCGDINAFFTDYFEEDWQNSDQIIENSSPNGKVAEINLMVAEKASRRKGIAEEAIQLFSEYIKCNIGGIRLLVAKIQLDNFASIKLFGKLGFHEFKKVECFNEVHFIKQID